MASSIPGPSGHPLLGSLNDMRGDFLQFLVTTARDYGPVAQFRAGPARMLLLSSAETVGEVLVKQAALFHKTRSTKRLLAALLGEGLISLEGDEHRRHRRVMQPAFHTRQVQSYTQLVVSYSLRWVEQRTEGEVIDILPALADLMLELVVATFFSANLVETARIRSALQAFSQALDLRVRSPIALPRWLPTKSNRILRHALTTLDRVIYDLIAERRRLTHPPSDLLTMLLEARDEETGQQLTDQEIRDEIATIFFAGYETTTTTLAWFWYLLTTHPAVWEKLHAEVTHVLGEDVPRHDHLAQMPFLGQVTKEVLRLYPAAWLFDREPIEDVTVGGYRIPARQTIFISPYLIHRNLAYFDSPNDFLPERFSDDLEKRLPRFAYLPFGAGSRICIGQTFALHTMSLVMATLLPRLQFELLPDQHIRPAAAATLVPAEGIKMRVHRLLS